MVYSYNKITHKLLPLSPFLSLHIRTQALLPPPSPLPLLPLHHSCPCSGLTCAPIPNSFLISCIRMKLMRYHAGGKQCLYFKVQTLSLFTASRALLLPPLYDKTVLISQTWKCFLNRHRVPAKAGHKNPCYYIRIINFHHSVPLEILSQN